jgi:uncharacterized delta-60 repeat protein/uncharacterized repeat protein (TIGR01451 family)
MHQLPLAQGIPTLKGHRIRCYTRLCLAVGLPILALLFAMLALNPGRGAPSHDQAVARCSGLSSPGELVNGAFRVAALVDGAWQEIGSLGYNQFPDEKGLSLANLQLVGEVKLRVMYPGDTAAHIDSALLDGQPPRSVAGASEETALALKKLASRDCDVIDARGKTLVFTFDAEAAPSVFSLVARIEPERIPEPPFQFPPENLYQTMSETSTFYIYRWNSRPGSLAIDGELAGEDLGTPFFKEFCKTGTGHPTGFTHGWVRNDDQNLYVAIDFVSDNTLDGDKDYAKVYVNTPAGLRGFKVSAPEQRWGMPGFTYTDRAVYQHKVYEFALPLAEIGLTAPESGEALALAFAAYGTGAPAQPPDDFPGRLDPSFGGDGIVTTTITVGDDEGHDLAIQPDGKLVVVGHSNPGINPIFALIRYNPDGNLDAGFGAGGVVTTDVSGQKDFGRAVALQPDGRIVIAGYSGSMGDYDFAVARYDPNGSPDLGFGSGGVVTTPIGSSSFDDLAVALQSDGRIVVAGTSHNGSDEDFAVARYTVSGTLDASFGSGGVVITGISGEDYGSDVAIQPDGRMVVVGTSGSINTDFALVRYTAAGIPDASFGVSGVVTTPIGTALDFGRAVALQPDGKIVVAGAGQIGSYPKFALARYTVSGTLDTSFGANGIVTTSFGASSADEAYAVAIQPDGRIVAAGENFPYSFALARYNADGSPEGTFGVGDYRVNTDLGNSSDAAQAVAIQADGKVVAAGYSVRGMSHDFALVRYGLDLILHKTVAPSAARPGQAITYTFVFSNNGATASGVKIVDSVPLSVGVTRIVSSGVPVTPSGPGPVYTWDVGELAYGQVGVLTISGILSSVLVAGPLTNTAIITPTAVDCNPHNNSSAAGVTVERLQIYLPLVLRNS